jgi:hypothetical protein
MMPPPDTSNQLTRLLATPIRDLRLTISGGRLGPLIAAFQKELEGAGVVRLKPNYYLSTEWGVVFGSVSLAMPFYLARADLIALHAQQVGFLEGAGRGAFLRYLRHEMGHVVNYAYRLYDRPDWTERFGPINVDYVEEYRLQPFSPRYVCHLPGWYAQKHPDEDWAETFAVWMTPGYDWRAAYADWPDALAKLEFCDRLMREINRRDPDVTEPDADGEACDLTCTLQQFYAGECDEDEEDGAVDLSDGAGPVFAPALDASLHGIFEDFGDREDLSSTAPRCPAGELIRRLERDLVADVYRWTGCFPERVRALVGQLAARADRLQQVYPADRETAAVAAITSLVTALAMDHVVRRGPAPKAHPSKPCQGASRPATE